ncbi:NAD-dependent epimerase/dehydratase family protein [Kitasatospora sp. LaBMicrA B282]|uniref:NAD-dependent epimerase/dehydratase family protein n=1 Tax=Kitasatospora sp. LaBMicrA B282 TaxID=3420949 RepID=UPI003D0E27D5
MPTNHLPLPQRALVTGSAGFIGSHLAQSLLANGATVIGVDRRDRDEPIAATNLGQLLSHPAYHHVTADLRTCAIEPLLVGTDTVFHLAGIPGVRPSWGTAFGDYTESNLLAAHRLLTAVTHLRIPRVVVASSSSVYGPTDGSPSFEGDCPSPASPYAVTKLAEEQLCLAHASRPGSPTTVVALRYFTVFGPRQRSDMFIHRALHAASTDTPLRLYGSGRQQRDFTYIDDAVTATIAAASPQVPSTVINVGGGATASLLDVIHLSQELTGQPIKLDPHTTRNGDVPVTRADLDRATQFLDYRPSVDLATGMRHQLAALNSPLITT